MRIAAMADIHGNLPALEAVLADIETQQLEVVVVAGDLTGGPYPCEVIKRLRSLGCKIIRGNGDIVPLRFAENDAPIEWHTYKQFAPARSWFRLLDQETIDFIATLPEQLVVALPGADPIRIVHGSPQHIAGGIYPDQDPGQVDEALAQIEEKVLVCGHTHTPWIERRGERIAVNAGSVGGPLNGHTGAYYAILEWQNGRWQAEHHLITYDLGKIRAAYVERGLIAEGGVVERAILLAIETGENVPMRFLEHAYRLAAQVAGRDCEFVPDAILDEAEATFDWDTFSTK